MRRRPSPSPRPSRPSGSPRGRLRIRMDSGRKAPHLTRMTRTTRCPRSPGTNPFVDSLYSLGCETHERETLSKPKVHLEATRGAARLSPTRSRRGSRSSRWRSRPS
eukprot:8094805-Pyramimonas_sp.AAC.1